MHGTGECNGLSIAREIREHFNASTLEAFEASVDFTRGHRADAWVRPAWSARAMLPEAFPLPPRRTEEQAAAFAELVEKANEKKRRTAEIRRVREHGAVNARALGIGGKNQ